MSSPGNGSSIGGAGGAGTGDGNLTQVPGSTGPATGPDAGPGHTPTMGPSTPPSGGGFSNNGGFANPGGGTSPSGGAGTSTPATGGAGR